MAETQTYQGDAGAYAVEDVAPFAYGRTAFCVRGVDGGGNPVCIKVFQRTPKTPQGDPALDEFASEIRAGKRLDHPHILPILDFGLKAPSSGGPFLVMPLCRGDLRSLLESRDYVPIQEALTVLQQVATAVDYAHTVGVLHGDIKPENILFARTGSQAYLSDFGVSRFFSFDEPITTMRRQDEAGSTAYLSPEQVSDGKQSTRSDIYSFAVVAYELLTGRLPIDRSQVAFRQMQAKVSGQLLDPKEANPNLPDHIRDALLRGLHVERDRRPASAMELCNELAGNAAPAPTRPAPGPLRFLRWWEGLDTAGRVAIITVLITAVFGLLGAIVGILPDLLTHLRHAGPAVAPRH
jgi:serine/threonine-protein kinase